MSGQSVDNGCSQNLVTIFDAITNNGFTEHTIELIDNFIQHILNGKIG